MISQLLVVLLACLANIVLCAVPADRVTSLPGLNGTLGTTYSGYIVVDNDSGRNFHYWFVQAEQSPTTAPLVVWLNGGPGCSSMDGFLYENGPWKFDPNSKTPVLVDNPWSWHKAPANMLFVESPAGVGFSYSKSSNDYANQNDDLTSLNNYNFLKAWFAVYPEYKSNPFWITGESYAGIYVPSLAYRVLAGVLDNSFVLNFKGIMVGNGVANGGGDDITIDINFLFGHGIISNNLYKNIVSACGANPTSQCNTLKNQARNKMNGIDIYDLYADCYHQRSINNVNEVPPCTDAYYATTWLNTAAVKTAIHVNPSVTWDICSNPVGNSYNRTRQSMIPNHKKLIQNGVRVLIYSGDADYAVPYTDSEYWTSTQMGLTATREWAPWYYNDPEGQQVAGFVTDYPGGFSFATIKGSGHMVPQYAPQPAFVFFQKFLAGTPL